MLGVRNQTIRSYSLSYFCHVAGRVLNTKISKLVIILLVIGGLGHIVISRILSNLEGSIIIHKKDHNEDQFSSNIKSIDELQRIKRSVATELRELESKRNKLHEDITGFQKQSKEAEAESKRANSDLESIKRKVLQIKNERLELLSQNPRLPPPVRLLPGPEDNINIPAPKISNTCRMFNCFDYSRCSVTSQFPIYIYSPSYTNGPQPVLPIMPYIIDAANNAFKGNSYVTSDPNIACLYVAIIGEVEPESIKDANVANTLERWLTALPYWRGDGRNHILVHLSRQISNQNLLHNVNTGRAMVAQSAFSREHFRPNFDIILPSFMATEDKMLFEMKTGDAKVEEEENENSKISSIIQVPIFRDYLLSFQGRWSSSSSDVIQDDRGANSQKFHHILVEKMKELLTDEQQGKIFFQANCEKSSTQEVVGFKSEWQTCGTTESRIELLSKSTFSLVVTPDDNDFVSTTLLTTRLAESLYSGSVPVILGNQAQLPFDEYIDWAKAAILWPKARITELPFLLTNYPPADIFAMRSQGRFLYDNYFATDQAIIDSMLAVIRTRLSIPPKQAKDEISTVVPHQSYKFEKEVAPGDAQSEFAVPPPEGKVDSPKFVHNFTFVTLDAKDHWNKFPGPLYLYPSMPHDRILPSDAKFLGSSAGFRPIGEGQGGVGKAFQQSLGGNVPQEQFTIILLTYEREEVMIQCLQRLKGLPHLNKVIVVWNSPDAPADDLQWPEIEVEVVVVRPTKNSLNNRFLPFNEIDTDAVLSIDDDAHLRHDEILFSFRVWREQRDKIVGFPGRYHAWDISKNEWRYNSDYCCELSMVLTGAAFFHKYYMYLYTYWIPQEIRDKVDEYMNCEDIAMNFLVSHITRAPPVKVTSRWTFRCPGCPEALSQSQSHYDERHICINYFAKIFGYMPLLATQFRTDSILFKTRLPANKQKCFKFI